MHLTHCRRGLGGCTIAWNAKKHLITRISTSVNHNTLVACVRKRACLYKPSYTRFCKECLVYLNSTE